MVDFNNSPSMQLPVPVVGVAPGPEWAALLNSCLARVDGHDHTPGNGVKITPSGLNISADLSINSNNLALVRTVSFAVQSALLPDLGVIYVKGVDLYYNDVSGNPIQITRLGGVAGTPGSISNLTAPASATFVALSGAFVWQAAANISADMDFGSAIMRNDTLNSFSLTLSPPAAMGTNSAITLPVVPSVSSTLLIDNTGAITTQPATQGTLPPGAVIDFAGASAPSGWLICDGTVYSVSTYPALAAVIGSTYGGDGVTNFGVPNALGRVTAGAGGALGGLSATGGEINHTLTVAEMPTHAHGVNDPTHAHATSVGNQNAPAGSPYQLNANSFGPSIRNFYADISTSFSPTNVSIQSNGGGGAHNNLQPYIVLNKIIKT